MFTLRVATFLWSFLRELLIEKKTLLEAAKTNPGRLFLIAVIFASLMANWHFIPKMFALVEKYAYLEKSYKVLQKESEKGHPSFEEMDKLKGELTKAKDLKCEPAVLPSPPPTSAPIPKRKESDVQWIRNQLEVIKQRELKDSQLQK